MWLVFDVDETLILNVPRAPGDDIVTPEWLDPQHNIYLCHDTLAILKYLVERGYVLTIASFRTNAREVLDYFGLAHYFLAMEYGRDERTKLTMIQNLASRLGLSVTGAIFFDDNVDNVALTSQALIHTVQVDPFVGTTLSQVVYAVEEQQKNPLFAYANFPLGQILLEDYFPLHRITILNPVTDQVQLLQALNSTEAVLGVEKQVTTQVGEVFRFDLNTLNSRYHLSVSNPDFQEGLQSLSTIYKKLVLT